MSDHLQRKKAHLFDLTVGGHESEPSARLRALAQDFARELMTEYESRKRDSYDLLRHYPDDQRLKELWTDEYIEEFASCAQPRNAIERLRQMPAKEVTFHDLHEAFVERSR